MPPNIPPASRNLIGRFAIPIEGAPALAEVTAAGDLSAGRIPPAEMPPTPSPRRLGVEAYFAPQVQEEAARREDLLLFDLPRIVAG